MTETESPIEFTGFVFKIYKSLNWKKKCQNLKNVYQLYKDWIIFKIIKKVPIYILVEVWRMFVT